MLKRSKDRKVANAATKGGAVAIANAFGLPAGAAFSCPGMTSVCESVCYARRTEKQYKGVSASVLHNWALLRSADYSIMYSLLSDMIAEFVAESDKRGAEKVFRIHWDGDFFSREYAEAWADICRAYPDVQFWVYTRSFVPALNVLDVISGIDNLAVYLSVDDDNMQYVAEQLITYPRLRIATLSDYADDGKDIIGTLRQGNKPGAACPENIKRIPLITAAGGACFTCGLCVDGKADVRFAKKKKERA